VFCTIENGLSLDVYVKPEHVDTVKTFFAQADSDDFEAVTAVHPYDAMLAFGEHGDEGNGFQPAPAFDRDRINCDDAEIAALLCTAIDGSTQIALESTKGHGGGIVAKDVVPMSLRPDSDFLWRSDPHEVNGPGSTTLNPGGDYLAAYWLARSVDIADPSKNLSALARPPLPYSIGSGGSGGSGGAGGGASSGGGESDCSCRTAGSHRPGSAAWAALALALAAWARRRRLPVS